MNPLDKTTAEDVTAMLEEVARLDAAATPGPWVAVYEDDGDIVLSDGGETHYPAAGEDYAFIRRARTLLPKFAAEVTALRAERDGWKVEAVHAKRLADLRQITKEEAEQRADAALERLGALREKARDLLAVLGDIRAIEVPTDRAPVIAAAARALLVETNRP